MPDTVPAGKPRSVRTHRPDTPETRSDPELIAATRRGDTTAYAVLYERHIHAARRLARVLAHDAAAADDLVSETFAELLHTYREGRGPDLAFRIHLLRTLRNTCHDRGRPDRKGAPSDPPPAACAPGAASAECRNHRYAELAFARLPERWQMVLWHIEVEGDSPDRIAAMLGITAGGVGALAHRARERLRHHYLAEHSADSPPEECRRTADRLGAPAGDRIGADDARQVDHHLPRCAPCRLLSAELTAFDSSLRGVIAPVVLGAGAAPYLASGTASVLAGAVRAFAAPLAALADPIRRLRRRLGARRGVAAAAALAVALAATIVALTSDGPRGTPETATDRPETVQTPDGAARGPEDDGPTAADGDPAEPDPEPGTGPGDPPVGADGEEPPAGHQAHLIQHDLGRGGLTAGADNVLPLRLSAAERGGAAVPDLHRPSVPTAHGQTERNRVHLDLVLPPGVRLASADAEPGWTCGGRGEQVHCAIDRLPDPPVAEVAITVPDGVTGWHTFAVAVDGPGLGGEAELRIPVAPYGSTVGFAGRDATGVTAAGNTWTTCAVPGCHLAARTGGGDRFPMRAYQPSKGHPRPPAGAGGGAVSGADLDVPAGAEVVWAGLYWSGADDEPREVALAGPGGAWTDLRASVVRGTGPEGQAFADVTDLVRGGGEYWLAVDDRALAASPCGRRSPGEDHCLAQHWAGWSLTAVFAESGRPAREVAVYDGPRSADTQIAVRGGGEVVVAQTVWGGSAYTDGDRLTVGGADLGEPATCRAAGAVNGPHWYTFGVDVAVHTVGAADAGTVRLSRGDDQFTVGVVAVAAPPG